MNQGFADIAQKARNTCQRTGTAQEQTVQQGLSPAIAANLVQVQGVGIAVHHTGQQEQGQLYQGVVHHVQHRTVGSQGIVLPQQGQGRRSHQDKADLGQGGAGQNILEVVGKHGDSRAQHHGHRPQHQQQNTPPVLTGEDVRRDDQGAEDARLGEDAGQQGTGRSRGHRVGLGQPDMQGKHARLGRKAEQDAQGRRPQLPPVRYHGAGVRQLGDDQGARQPVQQKQAHQGHKTAQHRNGQVGFAGVQSVRRFLLHHPGVGAEAHELEEQEGGIQVRRQEYTQGKAQTQQEEKVVAPQVVVAPEILGRQQGGHEPHEADHQSIDGPEAVQGKVDAAQGDIQGNAKPGAHSQHHHQKRQPRDGAGPAAQPRLAFAADEQQGNGPHQGQQDQKKQHHRPTAFPITSSSHWGNRPITRHAAASTAVGTVIIQSAS